MTNQENDNLKAILARAMEISAENKRRALRKGDIGSACAIAANEAKVETYFAERGVKAEDDK